ncbi:iron-containing alcohol dehydrogenase [Zymomonas mobilis subsp. mobilis ZM4 = ATCC 31821]|uniref:Iron-containing alcohol dehydrogenase n=2 Tax=Zymomonas mobilis TaxID=542 RepID=H2VFM0_ZYMMO|nr:iron-containing alcohol dehydrogenase [Zymomonas mobilis]AAD19418.1 NADH-dependent butanol dehydrogenase [Zymomonas mobilis subsp. mobilis ZM4 = ATCC 31821]AAV90395.1 iron-containing alcohol dehydrogenase [Zymomonas mobilis subsp. mobilis ZM4 = ATCC 31821]AVZ26583.1 iron-containing alcohol dehydrogenase [Zymomonas mobilis subsp. mobilis]AVZ28469.1 iron-containing alcohol dehydrogenase [Zymomonas mobilis subsp. mobilis]AVZ42915.1 iron-containing alcohol dehydrogenase [Zymomonas mobilis subsp
MLNFDYYNPTHIVFGKGRIAQLDTLLSKDARVLVLYGGSSAQKTGTLDEVRKALGDRTYFEFGGIEPNPSYETLMKAVEQVKQEKVDFLLAVGGGSVIDGTKFVAAAVPYEGEPWEILETDGKKIKEALPVGTVLTLPATGSEMNRNSVVTRKSIKSKRGFHNDHVFPVFSILDPTKVYTLPPRQLANGVVDSFIHITEQYLTYPVDGMVQDEFAEGLLRTLIKIGPELLKDQKNYDLAANFMWTATLALNGLIGAGVPQDWATHMVGHELTAAFGIDHGRTLAIILPSLLQNQREAKKGKLLQYAKNVWHIDQGSDDERIDAAIEKTRHFFESLGIPTHLKDYDVGEESIDMLVKELEAHGMSQLGEHKAITPEVSRAILLASL